MTSKVPAIVLSHGTGGLGAVRALARRGIPVTTIAYDANDPSLDSRYPQTSFRLYGSDDEREKCLLKILDELPDKGAVILTNSDRLVDLISRNEDALQKKFRLAIPKRKVLQALNDKRQETRLIASLGFDLPKTIQDLPSRPEDLERQLRFPIIFKPYLYSANNQFPKKNEVIQDSETLRLFYQRWRDAIPHLLAQEVIPGPDSYSWISSCTFNSRHELLDCGIKQKLRAYPAHFGGSTYAVSAANPEIERLTGALGKKLQYVGHAGVEFRWDARDACFKYIEINPRLPANVGFDESCGLPTVWNSYKVAVDQDVRHSGTIQKNGIYFLDLKFDLMSLHADRTSIPGILAAYAKLAFKPRNGMYFAWDDPMPGLLLAGRFFAGAVKYAFRKIGIMRSPAGIPVEN
ncbi:MAG: hypothetical protein ACR2Q3_11115 [Woeseiaceae bacterium]